MSASTSPTQACSQFGPVIDPGPSTLKVRIAAMARRGWRAYWERRARRATVLILCSLDDRTLRDIGISPSEIELCVYGRGNDRRRRYNASWPWRSRA